MPLGGENGDGGKPRISRYPPPTKHTKAATVTVGGGARTICVWQSWDSLRSPSFAMGRRLMWAKKMKRFRIRCKGPRSASQREVKALALESKGMQNGDGKAFLFADVFFFVWRGVMECVVIIKWGTLFFLCFFLSTALSFYNWGKARVVAE